MVPLIQSRDHVWSFSQWHAFWICTAATCCWMLRSRHPWRQKRNRSGPTDRTTRMKAVRKRASRPDNTFTQCDKKRLESNSIKVHTIISPTDSHIQDIACCGSKFCLLHLGHPDWVGSCLGLLIWSSDWPKPQRIFLITKDGLQVRVSLLLAQLYSSNDPCQWPVSRRVRITCNVAG